MEESKNTEILSPYLKYNFFDLWTIVEGLGILTAYLLIQFLVSVPVAVGAILIWLAGRYTSWMEAKTSISKLAFTVTQDPDNNRWYIGD